MEENKLRNGDISKIAQGLNCTPKAVEFIINGKRGKRRTDFSSAVKQAIDFVSEQNEAFEAFCSQLKVKSITPEKVSK